MKLKLNFEIQTVFRNGITISKLEIDYYLFHLTDKFDRIISSFYKLLKRLLYLSSSCESDNEFTFNSGNPNVL